jgi:hypothetical protein
VIWKIGKKQGHPHRRDPTQLKKADWEGKALPPSFQADLLSGAPKDRRLPVAGGICCGRLHWAVVSIDRLQQVKCFRVFQVQILMLFLWKFPSDLLLPDPILLWLSLSIENLIKTDKSCDNKN